MSRLSTSLSYLILGWLISLQLVNAFDKECHMLAGRMAGGSFKTIGQLNGRLLMLTKDDLVYNLDATSLNNSHIFVNQTRPEKMVISGQFDDTKNSTGFTMDTATTLQFNKKNGSVLFGILRPQKKSAFRAFASVWCKVGSDVCQTHVADYHLPTGHLLDPKVAFINSPEPETFNLFDARRGSISRYCINGTQILQCSPNRYICRKSAPTGQLTLSNQTCNDWDPLKLNGLANGFTGFISQHRLYLFGLKDVHVIDWPADIGTSTVVNITSVPFRDFISCQEPEKFISYSILSLLILSFLSVAINIFLFCIVLKQCGICTADFWKVES